MLVLFSFAFYSLFFYLIYLWMKINSINFHEVTRQTQTVGWEVLVTIHTHFPSPFTRLCLQIFSDRWFNSGAFYFMLCNTLIITVSRWVCYMRISHLLFISSPVIWVVWLSVWFKKVSNYPRKISLKTHESIFQSFKTSLCFLKDNYSNR